MRHKKTLIGVFLFLGLGLSGLKAQNTLFVNEASGTKTSFVLSDIRKLTFPAGSITVTKKDLTSKTFTLSDISYLNFNILPTGISAFKAKESSIKLYPNPATNQLHVSFESVNTGKLLLEIHDMHGRIIQYQDINRQIGTNLAVLNIAELPAGLYICLIHNGSKIETIKFLKN